MRKTFLFLLLLLLLFFPASLPFRAESIEGLSQPYFFTLAGWEVESLLGKGMTRVQAFWTPLLPQEREMEQVQGYFFDDKAMESKQVEAILERQIAQILRQEGLPFPPVLFRLDKPPHLLVISPRERIELTKSLLLQQEMSIAQIEALERRVEALGLSALVEGLGGIASYPSLIPASSLKGALQAAAHEWLHQYFFFHPLGRSYGRSQEMTTINESAADLAGEEIAARLLSFYGVKEETKRPPPQNFDFNQEMRQIRLQAEDYLARGEADRAEQFMKEKREFLAQKGYHLRKLNQAYFAYHGLYISSPGFISPIGEELKRLRQASPSLGEFVRKVAQISSHEELKRLLSTGP